MGDPAQRDVSRSRPSVLLGFVGLAVLAGIYGFCAAGHNRPGFALDSNLIYRSEVGIAFLAVLYIVGVALWLAWYGKGFFEINIAGSGLKAPGADEVEEAGDDVSEMATLVDEVRMEVGKGLKELDERVKALEDEH